MRLCLLTLCGLSACATPQFGGLSRQAWLELERNHFEPPPQASVDTLFEQSEALLDVEDPKLRDDVGYGLSVAWLVRSPRVSDGALHRHVGRLVERLSREDGGVLGRSYAALRLSMVAAAELKTPRLDDAEREQLVSAATLALTRESDWRGYDAQLGWVHATAHLADLLKFLSKNQRLTSNQRTRIVEAVLARLSRGEAFRFGEDERLAQVLRWQSLAPTPPLEPINAWLDGLKPQWAALWAAQPFDVARYTALNNTKLTLRAWLFFLDAEDNPSAEVQALRTKLIVTSAGLM